MCGGQAPFWTGLAAFASFRERNFFWSPWFTSTGEKVSGSQGPRYRGRICATGFVEEKDRRKNGRGSRSCAELGGLRVLGRAGECGWRGPARRWAVGGVAPGRRPA